MPSRPLCARHEGKKLVQDSGGGDCLPAYLKWRGSEGGSFNEKLENYEEDAEGKVEYLPCEDVHTKHNTEGDWTPQTVTFVDHPDKEHYCRSRAKPNDIHPILVARVESIARLITRITPPFVLGLQEIDAPIAVPLHRLLQEHEVSLFWKEDGNDLAFAYSNDLHLKRWDIVTLGQYEDDWGNWRDEPRDGYFGEFVKNDQKIAVGNVHMKGGMTKSQVGALAPLFSALDGAEAMITVLCGDFNDYTVRSPAGYHTLQKDRVDAMLLKNTSPREASLKEIEVLDGAFQTIAHEESRRLSVVSSGRPRTSDHSILCAKWSAFVRPKNSRHAGDLGTFGRPKKSLRTMPVVLNFAQYTRKQLRPRPTYAPARGDRAGSPRPSAGQSADLRPDRPWPRDSPAR